jgi:hypothetical protein
LVVCIILSVYVVEWHFARVIHFVLFLLTIVNYCYVFFRRSHFLPLLLRILIGYPPPPSGRVCIHDDRAREMACKFPSARSREFLSQSWGNDGVKGGLAVHTLCDTKARWKSSIIC